MKKTRFYYYVLTEFVLYFILMNSLDIVLFNFIGLDKTLALTQLYTLISKGAAMLIVILWYKKRSQIKFSLKKVVLNRYWVTLLFFSGALGVASNWFGHWPYLFPYILEMAEKSGAGNPDIVTTISSTPILLIWVGIIAPVLEELFYRGVIYNQCEKEYGVKIACVLSAFIWAIVHGWIGAFLYTIPIGILLAYLYYKTRNIFVPILIHIANNLYGMGIKYADISKMLEILHVNLTAAQFIKLLVAMGSISLLIILSLLYFLILKRTNKT